MELTSGNKICITPNKFYGSKTTKVRVRELEKNYNTSPVPFELTRLLGPTSVWKVFKKQAEVLAFVKTKRSGLMAFVFQQNNGERLFLAAHPRWLWHYDSRKDPSCRCSYEIISEYTVCKLYFDLEFEIASNPNNSGVAMTDIFIKVVCFYIKSFWKLVIDRTFIIDLDSSTDTKFSRHLIFNIPGIVFRDNYNAGSLVKYICFEVRCCLAQLSDGCECKHPLITECCVEESALRMLQVTNSKGKAVLFCDEGVYTKNRHFRLFKSTKLKKNASLILSEQNLYVPSDKSLKNIEEQFFLDSLITYLPNEDDNCIKILHFNDENKHSSSGSKLSHRHNSENCKSPFPKIDQFIERIVYPGHVWRNNYFQTSNKIVYDIIGNRYCGNIGRQHRSNNVKQIVDIDCRCYYQKCYDPDCSTYRSEMYELPPEIQFYLEDEFDSYISENNISLESSFSGMDDSELFEIADVVEQISSNNVYE